MMLPERPAYRNVGRVLVCHQDAVVIDPAQYLLLDLGTTDIVYRLRERIPVALYSDYNRSLLRTASTLPGVSSGLAADISLVSFDYPGELFSQRALLKSKPDTVSHEPRRLVGAESEFALELESGDPLLGRADLVECKHPLAQRDMRVLHDGSYGHRKLPPALTALQQTGAMSLALKPVYLGVLRCSTAMRAYRPFGPAYTFEISPRFILCHLRHFVLSHFFPFDERIIQCRKGFVKG